MRRILWFSIMCMFLSGCTAAGAVIAMNRSTDHFIQIENDERVLYEKGADLLAQKVLEKLDTSIQIVEDKQYSKFKKPVRVYVLNSIDRFSKYCVSKRPRGCVLNERLFISPKAKDTFSEILTHELSHLHMEQQLGMWNWHSETPPWFQEGLAVYVSDGAGAEKIKYSETIESIAKGKSFLPNDTGSLLFPKTASDFGLEHQMFYSQSGIFVEYLHESGKLKFKELLLSLANGSGFSETVNRVYGKSLKEIWKEFHYEIEANKENSNDI